MSMNEVTLTGRLTKDPELSRTSNGNSLCKFTLAVDKSKPKDAPADGNSSADFIGCVAWRQSAEYLCNYGEKGQMCGVHGRIQTRNYLDKDGRKVYVTEVNAEHVELYGSAKKASSDRSTGGTPYTKDQISQDISETDFNTGPALDLEPEDLPF